MADADSSTSAKFIGNIGHTTSSIARDDLAGTLRRQRPRRYVDHRHRTVRSRLKRIRCDNSGRLPFEHATGQFTQTVTIQNKSAAAIGGPISLVFDNLSSTQA